MNPRFHNRLSVLVCCAALALLYHSCDRDRVNPIDPESSLLQVRPPTPSGLAAVPGAGFVSLAWEQITERDLAGYGLFRAEESNGDYEFVPGDGDSTVQITTGKTSFIDSIGPAGQTFFYRLSAVNVGGLHSDRSAFIGATVLADLVAPAAPQILSAILDESEPGRVIVRWSSPTRDEDGGPLTGLASYVLLRSKDNTGSFVVLDTLAADVTDFVDQGLDPLTDYAYALIGLDFAGNESSQATGPSTQTGGILTPDGLVATGQIGQIDLTWAASEDESLTGYNLYRSDEADGTYALLAATALTSYEDVTATVGST